MVDYGRHGKKGESAKLVFEARQKLNKVKTDDEKEYGDIDDADRKLEKETK